MIGREWWTIRTGPALHWRGEVWLEPSRGRLSPTGCLARGRGSRDPLDAGREPDQVAPRASSWCFETFVRAVFAAAYHSPDPRYADRVNSCGVQAGERHCRAKRGLVTRPTARQVYEYRACVDDVMRWSIRLMAQQHQELVLIDIQRVPLDRSTSSHRSWCTWAVNARRSKRASRSGGNARRSTTARHVIRA